MNPTVLRALLLSPAFSPAKWYLNGEAGIWLDQSDAATGYQDSAATTVNVLDSPIGKRLDKSGRGNHVLQATASARPLWKLEGGIYSDLCDGVDDGIATATFPAGTLTSNMDCFIAVKRNSAAKFVLVYQTAEGTPGFAVADSAGGAGVAHATSGTPTYSVNGVAVPGGTATTRVQLDAAMPVGEWLVLEVKNLDLSAWTALAMCKYGLGFNVNGQIGGVILAPAQTDTQRAKARRYLGRKVGLSL